MNEPSVEHGIAGLSGAVTKASITVPFIVFVALHASGCRNPVEVWPATILPAEVTDVSGLCGIVADAAYKPVAGRPQRYSPEERVFALLLIERVHPPPEEALPTLIQILRSDTPEMRRHAARIVCRYGPAAKGAVASLIILLREKRPVTRFWAARALGAVGPDARSAVAALEVLRADAEAHVRHAAIAALMSIRTDGIPAPAGGLSREP